MYSFLTLNDTVVLQKSAGADEYGISTFSEAVEVAVQLRYVDSLKKYQGSGALNVVTYEICFPATVDVSVSDAVVIDGKTLTFKTFQRFRDLSGNVIYSKVTA